MSQTAEHEQLGQSKEASPQFREGSIPGPVDRVSFLDEQRRRRRQGRLLSTLCALAAMVMSVPLSMLVTPPLFILLVLIAKGSSIFIALPDAIWNLLRDWTYVVPNLLESVAEPEKAHHLSRSGMLLGGLLLLAPGMVGMILVWFALKARFMRSGVASIILSLGGRVPHSTDLEERQLVNVAEEMALAAGVKPPGVRILDCDAPSAAVVGTSSDNATLLVSRRLLDCLDRDETQGVVAHLTASVGNGDPQVALTAVTISQMLGLLFTTLDALLGFSRSAWREWKLALAWLCGKPLDPEVEASLLESLTGGVNRVRDDGLFNYGAAAEEIPRSPETSIETQAGAGVRVAGFILWPLRLPEIVGWMIRAEMMLLIVFLVGPVVMFILRSRRYLADSCAVQLTRNPDGLARGLTLLAEQSEPLPGRGWADHLFVAGTSTKLRMQGFSRQLGGFVLPHPPITKRVRRLEAQGASQRFDPSKKRFSWRNPTNILAVLLVAPMLALAAGFLMIALGLAFALALGFAFVYEGAMFGLVRLIL